MEIKSDIRLKGTVWNVAIEEFKEIFTEHIRYSLFMLSLSIGILYDKRIEKLDIINDEEITVPRTVISNNDYDGKLDLFFQTAILFTSTEELSEDERLHIAFAEKTEFNKINLLIQFANFGITKLVEQIGNTTIETMENLKNYLITLAEGKNFDIGRLPDDILLDEE